mmetsp:Transcript_106362/g.295946  ORF Transcript_106362/g.295946 Transcript_106362/m.295946 type:complete len:257 (+) Transcript_106362:105-875(+)
MPEQGHRIALPPATTIAGRSMHAAGPNEQSLPPPQLGRCHGRSRRPLLCHAACLRSLCRPGSPLGCCIGQGWSFGAGGDGQLVLRGARCQAVGPTTAPAVALREALDLQRPGLGRFEAPALEAHPQVAQAHQPRPRTLASLGHLAEAWVLPDNKDVCPARNRGCHPAAKARDHLPDPLLAQVHSFATADFREDAREHKGLPSQGCLGGTAPGDGDHEAHPLLGSHRDQAEARVRTPGPRPSSRPARGSGLLTCSAS